MKKLTLILSALVLLGGLTGCDEKGKEPSNNPSLKEVNVSPSSARLKPGETQQLTVTWTPETVKVEVAYESEKPEIATVDENGLITAVAVGETKINVKVGKITKSCTVFVIDPTAPELETELPLLKFDAEYDENNTLVDQEIIDHETKIGRTPMNITPGNNPTFPGFGNEQLTISGAIYGLQTSASQLVIIACSTEEFPNVDKTVEMVKKYGFSSLELVTDEQTGEEFYVGMHDSDETLAVQIFAMTAPEVGGKTGVWFLKAMEKEAPEAEVAHAPLKDVVDFPGLEQLEAADLNGIKEYEEGLGFRDYIGDAEFEGSSIYPFQTKEDQIANSNIIMAQYYCAPQSGPKFVVAYLNCIANDEDLTTNQELVAWLETNGFTGVQTGQLTDGTTALVATKGNYQALIFFESNVGFYCMQVADVSNMSNRELRSLNTKPFLPLNSNNVMTKKVDVNSLSR